MSRYQKRLLKDIRETMASLHRFDNRTDEDWTDIHTLRTMQSQVQQMNMYINNLLGSLEFQYFESLDKTKRG